MEFKCPHCHQNLEADNGLAGQQLPCPYCSKLLTVPVLDAGSVPPEKPGRKNACPGCGGELPPNTIICVQCGFNLKTGKFLPDHHEKTDDRHESCHKLMAETARGIIRVMSNKWIIWTAVLSIIGWFAYSQINHWMVDYELYAYKSSNISHFETRITLPKNLPYIVNYALHGPAPYQKNALDFIRNTDLILIHFDRTYWKCPAADRLQIIDLLKEQPIERARDIVTAAAATFRKEVNPARKARFLEVVEKFTDNLPAALVALGATGDGKFEPLILNRIAELNFFDRQTLSDAVNSRGKVNTVNIDAAIAELDKKWHWSGLYALDISMKQPGDPIAEYLFSLIDLKNETVKISKKGMTVLLTSPEHPEWRMNGRLVKEGIEIPLPEFGIRYGRTVKDNERCFFRGVTMKDVKPLQALVRAYFKKLNAGVSGYSWFIDAECPSDDGTFSCSVSWVDGSSRFTLNSKYSSTLPPNKDTLTEMRKSREKMKSFLTEFELFFNGQKDSAAFNKKYGNMRNFSLSVSWVGKMQSFMNDYNRCLEPVIFKFEKPGLINAVFLGGHSEIILKRKDMEPGGMEKEKSGEAVNTALKK